MLLNGELVDEASMTQYILDTFEDIQIAEADGNSFYYYSPDGKIPERTFPFATLVTNDLYDTVSDLNRPSVYRLNVAVSKDTYQSLLGALPKAPGSAGVVETGHDFTVLDQLMPHPIYGHMAWVCVLNPGTETLQTVQNLLAEAYEAAVRKQMKRAERA